MYLPCYDENYLLSCPQYFWCKIHLVYVYSVRIFRPYIYIYIYFFFSPHQQQQQKKKRALLCVDFASSLSTVSFFVWLFFSLPIHIKLCMSTRVRLLFRSKKEGKNNSVFVSRLV